MGFTTEPWGAAFTKDGLMDHIIQLVVEDDHVRNFDLFFDNRLRALFISGISTRWEQPL